MKAVRINAPGGIAQLRYEDCDEPVIESAHDVIVKLKAASINRIDLALRSGAITCDGLPRILGADGAGIVHAIGAGVRNVQPRDAVCLFPFHSCNACEVCRRGEESLCTNQHLLGARGNGTYAEYVRVPEKNCFAIPRGLSFEEAAALPLVTLMAWRMLVADADVKPGEWVLIVGAGGVATAALQLAASLGARVIVAARDERKLAAALGIGAAHAVRLDDDAFKSARACTGKRGVDVAVNCVGGETWAGSLAALARGGRLVSCGALAGSAPKTDLRRIFWNHLKILTACSATRAEFVRVLDYIAAARHKPLVDKVFPLKEASLAQERMESGAHFGKIVLRIE